MPIFDHISKHLDFSLNERVFGCMSTVFRILFTEFRNVVKDGLSCLRPQYIIFRFPFHTYHDFKQEIIKVREWIPNIDPISKVIPLKLFLDIVPSSSADITRALRECFRGEFTSFRFVSKQRKTSNAVGMSSLIFWFQGNLGSRYVLIYSETLIGV